jgi:hypothetical protein
VAPVSPPFRGSHCDTRTESGDDRCPVGLSWCGWGRRTDAHDDRSERSGHETRRVDLY